MKTAVIAPLGLSPPVATAFINGIGERVNDLVLIVTEDENVMAGFELVRIGMKLKYPRTRVHMVVLPFDDIYTTEDNLVFMSIAAKTIKEERERYNCDRVLLNVAGGRKNMCITLSLLGQLMGVDGVYHVVNKNVSIINQALEALREDIKRMYLAKNEEEKIKIYKEKEEYFDHLLFPKKDEYEIIRIPTLPYPKEYLTKIVNSVLNNLEELSEEEKLLLERHGILKKLGRRFYLTEYGKEFLRVLLGR
ncbi:CRISPR-associated protein Csx14 [Thermococci archaeon]|nr:MAG: CRISPR-associated protein Csx14 [Thermococci archaeon]